MRSNGTSAKSGSSLRKVFLAAIALAIATLSCNAEEMDALGIKLKIDKRRLSNGLTVIMVEDHTVPIVSYQTWYRVGSVDEKPGQTGLAHLFEHLMFKGTPKYGPKQIFQELEAKGAEVNAFTTRDYTVYYEAFVPALLEKVIDIESDRMENLTISEELLQSERMVVFEERRLRTDSVPEGRIQESLWQLAYHRHPYQWPVIGYPQDLLTVNAGNLQEFFKKHYQPANAAIVIVGDIHPEATFAAIKKQYGKIPGRAIPSRDIPNEPDQEEERRLVLRDHVSSEKFAQAYHVTAAKDDDSYALDVLANILFEGTSSRAYRRLVDEKDIAAAISGTAFTPAFPGLFIISGTMKRGVPSAEAEKELSRLILEVQDKEVTKDEIQRAVRQLTVQLVDSVRTPSGLANLIGTVHMVFGDSRKFTDDLAKYLKVTAADVRRVAQKYLTPNNRSIVTLVPEETAKGSEK